VAAKDKSRKSSNAVTMHSVAAHAGVSPMSVSNVINGRKVRPATRDAVLRSIEALNYKPNAAARALASATTMRIGLVYSSPDSAFVSAMLVGALDAATRCGAQLLIRRSTSKLSDIRETILALVEEDGANALLLPAPYCEVVSRQDLLKDLGEMPLMGLCAGSELPDVTSVRIDDFAAAYDMTTHLIGLGHRRIAFIRAAAHHRISETRYAGYRQALQDAGIVPDDAIVADGDLTFDMGIVASEALLNLPVPPSAIFASNDDTAAAVISVAHRRGIHVPEQLSVAGFDDSPTSTRLWPPLTTIRQPIIEMTNTAIEVLARRFAEGDVGSEHTIYAPYEIVTRGSTARMTQPI
jgi:LacI family transcriptional regulator